MSPLPFPIGRDAEQTVRRPHPSDAIGAALRVVFDCRTLPEDLAQLVRQLDRTP